MVETVIRNMSPEVIKDVTASRGKYLRAEPIAAFYERGKVHHVGGIINLKMKCVSGYRGQVT